MRAVNRRDFLATGLGGWGAVMVMNRASAAEGVPGGRLRLGGPVFTEEADPEALARAYRSLGYAAAYCPQVSLSDLPRIRAYEEAFRRNDVVIAEVGRWVNLMDADPALSRQHLQTVTDGLRLADEIGALCCVDIAGSRSKDTWYGPHPENLSEDFFDAAVENARKIIDAVKPRRAKFCYEMMGWAIPDSAASCLRLIQAVDRGSFGAHLDPCNLVNSPEKFYDTTRLLEECFELLGPHIVSCHAKDLRWEVEMNVHFREVIPGTGNLDYGTYLRRLAALPNPPPLMLEHLETEKDYDQARGFVLRAGEAAGVKFI